MTAKIMTCSLVAAVAARAEPIKNIEHADRKHHYGLGKANKSKTFFAAHFPTYTPPPNRTANREAEKARKRAERVAAKEQKEKA